MIPRESRISFPIDPIQVVNLEQNLDVIARLAPRYTPLSYTGDGNPTRNIVTGFKSNLAFIQAGNSGSTVVIMDGGSGGHLFLKDRITLSGNNTAGIKYNIIVMG